MYKPREDKAGKPKLRTLSQHEVQALLRYAHCHNREVWIVLCFAVYTGARIGEILALTRSDIDLDKRRITINKQLTVTDPSNHKVRGIAHVKSKHSNRTVPIPPSAGCSTKRVPGRAHPLCAPPPNALPHITQHQLPD